ncbi:efflux transporter outer membrane subunit [Aliidiomarina sp.]|uniref:efflux transporter outer membrane subunit n=1 Tax=Aliidiomarina sp. TaxID=1872439 RepID=UPI003A4D8D2D
MKPFILAAIAVSVLSACTVGPDYQASATPLSEQWPELEQAAIATSSANSAEWQQWWQQYQDPTLNALVNRALADNLNLQIQISRIEQARAQLGLREAERWPMLSAQASAAREQQPSSLMPAALGGGSPRNQFAVAGVLSYEVDLWGRISRQREAANAMLAQSVFGAEAVQLSLISDVISTYFSLLALEQQQAAATAMLASQEETLAIEQYRYERGASSALNVRRAEAAVASAQAALPDLNAAVRSARSALALLVGYSPEEMLGTIEFATSNFSAISTPSEFPTVTPSELLKRRPDIRAAEANLQMASAQVGVAVAQRFPSLNLSGLVGSAASDSSDLFGSGSDIWSIGADLAGPIFDFGRRKNVVLAAEAALQEAELSYQQAIVAAVRDASDALYLLSISDQRLNAAQQQYQAITNTVTVAERQYDQGAIGLFELLESQRALLTAEMTLSDAKSQQLTARTNLFKALGGGW